MSGRSTRRHLLGDAIAGLAGAAILAGAGVAIATPETLASEHDAELVRLCADYMEALDTYDLHGGILDCNVDPLWHRCEQLQEQIEAAKATTISGVTAKVRVARHWATQRDGSIDFDDPIAQQWMTRVAFDLLRMNGTMVDLGGVA